MRYRTELMDEILKSQTAQRIIDFVAPIYGNGYVALWMFQAIGKPLDAIASFVDSLRDQTIPQTATWSLPIWEREYGITPEPAWTDAQRQANLVSKMKYIPPVNPAKLAEYASAAAGVPCEVIENIAKNTFAVVLRANSDTIDRAKQAIDEGKPAHLIYIIYVALLRETQADVCAVVAGSRRTVYPDAEVEQWQRTARAVQYAAVTGTKNRTYTEIEVQ